jgi:TRAP-type C4-dicarboxylate transport system permease small subunit
MVRFRINKTIPRPPRAIRSWRRSSAALALLQQRHRGLRRARADRGLRDPQLQRARPRLFHSANYWQDEAAVFLLVGATFMTAAYVQGQRGHIGIEAFVGLLSPLANRIRLWLVDVASLLFCAFFAWKSWTLAHEAWVDGQVSNSMWSPPLAIPYVLMALGMTLLCVQILLQIIIPFAGASRR